MKQLKNTLKNKDSLTSHEPKGFVVLRLHNKRKDNKTFLKNIKTNYQDREFLDSLENKE